jgi:hypothetical protein
MFTVGLNELLAALGRRLDALCLELSHFSVSEKTRLAVVPPLHDMQQQPGKVDARAAWHGGQFAGLLRARPFSLERHPAAFCGSAATECYAFFCSRAAETATRSASSM